MRKTVRRATRVWSNVDFVIVGHVLIGSRLGLRLPEKGMSTMVAMVLLLVEVRLF